MPLLSLAHSLTTVASNDFSGWLMAAAELSVTQKLDPFLPELPQARIEKRRAALAVLTAALRPATLQVTLVSPNIPKRSLKEQYHSLDQPIYLEHRFTHKELHHYLTITADKNPLHQGSDPIIPGLCLFWQLFNALQETLIFPCTITIRFLNPLPVNTLFRLYQEDHHHFIGYVGEVPICTLTITTERTTNEITNRF